jgi:trehalose synthase
MHEVEVSPMSPERFASVLSRRRYEALERATEEAQDLLAGRVVWNVNSTARGGGVAELLRPLVAYARGAGIDVRWVVIEGERDFFAVTKRLHNRLHGSAGDGGALDGAARHIYERTLKANEGAFMERVRAGDVVIVHDPQPAGLIGAARGAGAAAIWRCHVGLDHPNELAREAWAFLLRYVEPADAYVFSRKSFAWEGLDRERIAVIPPSIDVFAPKNEELSPQAVRAVLIASGLIAGDGEAGPATFAREDGTPGRVDRRARLIEEEPLRSGVPVVLQVSRWDALKDPLGVVRGFAEHVPASTGAHLVYAGPDIESVADDPEGERVLGETVELRGRLPREPRGRVHLATLPMEDPEENAIIVNALQRHASVVTQKSLAEGFGLTVAEAMWKARPVVASRIGGIQDQIVHGRSGILLDDPRDLETFGGAVSGLLGDPRAAADIGRQARARVRERFTSPRSLLDYLVVLRQVLERTRERAAA